MTEIIKIEGLGKRYKLGALEPYKTLSDKISNIFTKTSDKRKITHPQYKWALKDINLTVNQGDIVGIIGKNGSGKSTLLKVLSRITTPTEGYAEIKGRVGALLEVGTGFHPELTGRENVFMNGMILGMSKKDVQRQFDSIVDFSGVEEFIDTPVKRYSSGMKIRLGFAVAAHLEPEILIIDEVLAVGDAEFQKKCIGKMKDVSTEGRTVLFVSHQMEMIENICKRAVLLENGQIKKQGKTSDIIERYLVDVNSKDCGYLFKNDALPNGTGVLRIKEVDFVDNDNKLYNCLRTGDSVRIRMLVEQEKNAQISDVMATFVIRDTYQKIMTSFRTIVSGEILSVNEKLTHIVCNIPFFNLSPGKYFLNCIVRISQTHSDQIMYGYTFEVHEKDFFNSGKSIADQGVFLTPYSWNTHVS